MKEQKNNREKWLHVRLTDQEYRYIQEEFSRTTDQKMSIYIRKMILGQPHIGRVRNQSTDDLVNQLAHLRMELNAAGNNLNQAVKKLHTFRDFKQIEGWLLTWERDKKGFYKSLDAITVSLEKISDQW
ncbi:MAG: plasmid mobilization relaxosome protein MobC [Sphingobacterium sp.]|jgi:5-bromo-4-chloroindolyl phosphate hydrolysis protein|nr:plasmid mobilization relaxosome protein MobC [Sphingobacterium sp.]